MNSLEHLRESFLYNDWANRRVVFALRDSPSQKSLQIMAHLLVTEKQYVLRLYGKDSSGFDYWPALSRDECKQLVHENSESYSNLLNGFDDEGLDVSTVYKSGDGRALRNTYRELLTDVLFHSAGHRGQVNYIFRQEGFEPVPVEFVNYLGNF